MNRIATSDEYARLHDGSTLIIQRWFPGTADRLWTYLVDADLRRKWFADGVMQAAPGTALELVWRNDELSAPGEQRPAGMGGGEQRMVSQVVEVNAPHRLVILWGKGEVAFDLVQHNDRVRLTITHSGLDASQTGIFAGWHSHLDILSAHIEGTTIPSFWSTVTQWRDQYRTRLAVDLNKAG